MWWLADMDGNRETLKRIVALLFSLAMLAERASTSSLRVRSEMLLHIRRAQLAAWSMTLEDAYDLYAEPDLVAETFACGDSPADAAHLAVVLRALALILTVRFQLQRKDAPDHVHSAHPAIGAPRDVSVAFPLHAALDRRANASVRPPAVPP